MSKIGRRRWLYQSFQNQGWIKIGREIWKIAERYNPCNLLVQRYHHGLSCGIVRIAYMTPLFIGSIKLFAYTFRSKRNDNVLLDTLICLFTINKRLKIVPEPFININYILYIIYVHIYIYFFIYLFLSLANWLLAASDIDFVLARATLYSSLLYIVSHIKICTSETSLYFIPVKKKQIYYFIMKR